MTEQQIVVQHVRAQPSPQRAWTQEAPEVFMALLSSLGLEPFGRHNYHEPHSGNTQTISDQGYTGN